MSYVKRAPLVGLTAALHVTSPHMKTRHSPSIVSLQRCESRRTPRPHGDERMDDRPQVSSLARLSVPLRARISFRILPDLINPSEAHGAMTSKKVKCCIVLSERRK